MRARRLRGEILQYDARAPACRLRRARPATLFYRTQEMTARFSHGACSALRARSLNMCALEYMGEHVST